MRCALALVAAGLAFVAGPTTAQPADSGGRQTGPGVISAPAGTAVPGSERRTGPGVISAPDDTSRGSVLSPQEQRARTGSFHSYAECAVHRDQQRSEMAARAAARGSPMPQAPQRDVCAGLPR